ncbi:hypothetical protein C8J56DRAFT_893383 [Mycena floridula]|nr:hypothetical protein C8J56DRAFT_893383 [Mycena floridula]
MISRLLRSGREFSTWSPSATAVPPSEREQNDILRRCYSSHPKNIQAVPITVTEDVIQLDSTIAELVNRAMEQDELDYSPTVSAASDLSDESSESDMAFDNDKSAPQSAGIGASNIERPAKVPQMESASTSGLKRHCDSFSEEQGPTKKRPRNRDKKRQRDRQQGKAKRSQARDAQNGGPGGVKQCHEKSAENAKAEFFDFDTPGPTKQRAWGGPRDQFDDTGYTLKMLLGFPHNMKLYKWSSRNQVPIIDSEDRLVALLIGRPSDEEGRSWMLEVHDPLLEELIKARKECGFKAKELCHRRGTHASLTGGISFSSGQVRPKNLNPSSKKRGRIFRRLCSHPATKRIIGYGNTIPNSVLNESSLENAPRLLAAPSTLDLRPPASDTETVTTLEKDIAFHFVLWDLGLVIEFPPGSSILLMSATLEHSNTLIQPGETRCSLVQYSATGLFRWVENGGASDAEILRGGKDHLSWLNVRAERVKNALNRLKYRFWA